MPNDHDRSQIARIFRLLQIVAGGEAHSAAELSRLTGVTRRTIFRDIKAMQAAGVPIAHEPSAGCYRLRRGVLALPVDLSEDESLALVGMVGQLVRAAKIPMLATAQRALEKIRGQLAPGALKKLEALEERILFQLSGGEDGGQCQDVYDVLERALVARRVVSCRYEPAGSRLGGYGGRNSDPLGRRTVERVQEFELRPYGIFWHRGASYVVGHHGGRGELRTLRISRFAEVEVTGKTYRIPESFALKDFLGDAWGILRGEKSYQVELVFSGVMAEIVAESQWHATQETERNEDGSLTFLCRVDGLEEISRWVLSMGPHCRIVAPKALRDEVTRQARLLLEQYPRG